MKKQATFDKIKQLVLKRVNHWNKVDHKHDRIE